jgi:hypothetical protein
MIVRKKVNVTKIQVINNFGQLYHFTQLMKNDAHPMLNISFHSAEAVIKISCLTFIVNGYHQKILHSS